MRTVLSLSLALGCFLCLHAQTKPTVLTSQNLEKPAVFAKGRLLQVQCDSVIVFEKSRHNQSLQAFNATLQQFALIRQQYDSCAKYASEGREKLSSVNAALAQSITHAVDSASFMLRETRQNLNASVLQLNAASASLKNIQDLLEQEKKARRRRALGWGLGGFVTGALTAVIVVALTQ